MNVTNNTLEDGLTANDVIMQSGSRRLKGDLGRTLSRDNKVYPATDADEGNVSQANVGLAGMTSADERSLEGDDAKDGKMKANYKSKIQIVGYDNNANPKLGGVPDNAELRTIDGAVDHSATRSKRDAFSAYGGRGGFNTGSTQNPSLKTNFGQSQNQSMNGMPPALPPTDNPNGSMMAMQM